MDTAEGATSKVSWELIFWGNIHFPLILWTHKTLEQVIYCVNKRGYHAAIEIYVASD